MNGLKNKSMQKTIIITGASGGLGKAVTRKFLQESYTVIASSHSQPVVSDSGSVIKIKADLADEKSAATFISNALSEYGPISAAALLVGGFAMSNIADSNEKKLLEMYRLNFLTAWFCAKPLFQHMRQNQFGRIVLIGSVPGQNPGLGSSMVPYTLAKSQIFSLASILNAEGKDNDVYTSVIVPGTIDTEANRRSMPDADFSEWVKPDALADTIHKVCTAKASEISSPIFKMYREK